MALLEECLQKYPLPEVSKGLRSPEEWALICAADDYVEQELPIPDDWPTIRGTNLERARQKLRYEFMEEHSAEFGLNLS